MAKIKPTPRTTPAKTDSTPRSKLFIRALSLSLITALLIWGIQGIQHWWAGNATRKQMAQEQVLKKNREQALLRAAIQQRNLPTYNCLSKTEPPTTIETEDENGKTVSIDGTNEWGTDQVGHNNWYHKTGLVLQPGKRLVAESLNPKNQIDYNQFGTGTTITGHARLLSDLSADPPLIGVDLQAQTANHFGGLAVVLAIGNELINYVIFTDENQPIAIIINTSSQPTEVGLHRILSKNYLSGERGKVGVVYNDGYAYSGCAVRPPFNRWRIQLTVSNQ